MADKRITQLNELTSPANNDLFAVVDVSAQETKKVSYGNLTDSLSNTLVPSAYISCYSTQSQQLTTSGSAQPVTFTNVWTQKGVNSYFWVKYNGNNFPNSSTQMSLLARKNESTPSAQLMTVNIVGVAQNDNDYIELYWTGDSDTIQLNETPSDGVKPETPSVIANIVRVG